MLKAMFSFNGRLGRLAFIGWTLAATFLVFVITFSFLLFGILLAGFFSAEGNGPYLLGTAMAFVALIVGLWTTLALQAKRIQDIGLRPLTWMLLVSIIMVSDQAFLTPLTDLRFFPPLAQYTPLGGLAAAAYMIVLLCWPGVAEATTEPEAAAEPERRPARPAISAPPRQSTRGPHFGLRN